MPLVRAGDATRLAARRPFAQATSACRPSGGILVAPPLHDFELSVQSCAERNRVTSSVAAHGRAAAINPSRTAHGRAAATSPSHARTAHSRAAAISSNHIRVAAGRAKHIRTTATSPTLVSRVVG